MTNHESSESRPKPLLTQRSALILMTAACCGVVVGVLTAMSEVSEPTAILAGLAAGGSATVGLNSLIGP
ncbi:hypothetical protein [Micromonospora sp. RTGN7]|uniref:hypothetical protein n=1 Tax=Micromonospora sp. RTGN7 TaxID=3016526 RepID=UPI0029FF09BB|nr:hypothetical protein [Micromonospora sp. RTGN7]